MGQKPDKTAHLTSRKMAGSIDFRTLEPTEFFIFRIKLVNVYKYRGGWCLNLRSLFSEKDRSPETR